MKLLYFAWVRERIGKEQEVVELPGDVTTIGDLVSWLAARGDEYAPAFPNPKVVRAGIDRRPVKREPPLAAGAEVAFFPPMTGG